MSNTALLLRGFYLHMYTCWFVLLLSTQLSSQSLGTVPNVISIEEGLSSRKVKNILQDSYGWIWITTDISIHRYDGYEVQRMDEKLNVHIDQTIRSKPLIWEDKFKNIWINNQTEAVQYKPLTDEVNRFSFIGKGGMIDTILFAFIDQNGLFTIKPIKGNLLVFTQDGFSEVENTNNGIFNEYTERHLISMDLDHSSGYVLKASKFKSYILNSKYQPVREFVRQQFEPSKGLRDFGFNIIMGPSGKVYGQVKYDYFYEFDSTNNRFVMPRYLKGLSSKCRIGLFPDNDHIIFSSQGNIWEYSFSEDNLSPVEYNNQPTTNQIIAQMMLDATGGLWITTNFGANRVSTIKRGFRSIELNNKLTTLSYPNSVRSITNLSDNELLISCKQSNFIYNIQDKTAFLLSSFKNDMWSTVWAESELWGVRLGSEGIFKWNKTTKTFNIIEFPVVAQLPVAIAYDRGSLWTGDGPLIMKYHIASEKWTTHDWSYGRANDFYFENDNSIFIGCDNGLVQIDSNFNVLHILSDGTNSKVKSNKIQNIHRDPKGLFWLSTKGGGICIYNIENDSVQIIDKSEGLPNNTVYAVMPNGNKYWMPTDNGLALFDTTTRNINTFYTQHGLSHNEFNFPSHFEFDDNIYLGTLDGVTIIDKNANYLSDVKPSLFLTSVTTYDQKLKKRINHSLTIGDDNPLIMGVGTSNLEITMSLADYSNSRENRFAYLIEGFENEWRHLGNNHTLTIGVLPPGDYNIKLKGYTNNGVSTDMSLSLPLIVKRPFTHSWLFILMIAAVLGGFYYLLYRFRLYQLNRISEVRQRIAANLHDEVGSVMTYIALESDLLQAKIYAGDEVDKKLAEIATNSREASVMMSDIVWSFDAHQDKTENLVDRMNQYLHKMLTAKDVQYNFRTGEANMKMNLQPDVRQNVYLIFKEAIHNVVKHSNGDLVTVELKQEGKTLSLLISDNGNDSQTANAVSSGQGLRSMKTRAERIGANLKIEKENGFKVYLEATLS